MKNRFLDGVWIQSGNLFFNHPKYSCIKESKSIWALSSSCCRMDFDWSTCLTKSANWFWRVSGGTNIFKDFFIINSSSLVQNLFLYNNTQKLQKSLDIWKNFDKLLKFGWQRNKSLVIYNKFELFFIKYIAKI